MARWLARNFLSSTAMTAQQDLRDEFVATLGHIRGCFDRILSNSGPMRTLSAPDVHKLSEGLLLSAWTHWEEFLRQMFVADLATDPAGMLRKRARTFRSEVTAPWELSEAILGHPDEQRWIEWADVDDVVARADRLLSSTHRYAALTTRNPTIQKVKTIRNAVAHKSDRAWAKFKKLATSPPFSLMPNQMKGITTGRFISSHTWGASGSVVLRHVVDHFDTTAKALVP